MQKSHVDIIMSLFCLNENHCGKKKIIKKKKIAIVKNNIAIRIAGKVSRYIDASMNRATPSISHHAALPFGGLVSVLLGTPAAGCVIGHEFQLSFTLIH